MGVFLFIPNLIGYGRIILAFMSFYYMPFDPTKAVVTYLVSGLLDAFDGHAARYFNQSTKFGALLDMLTDRCVTTALLMMLSVFYPSYLFLFQFLVCLDISSHWIHVQSSLMKGSSHKAIDLSGNYFLRIYYKKVVLFIFCAGNELFFCTLYLIHFTPGPTAMIAGRSFYLFTSMALITAPICFLKQTVSVIQLVAACYNVSLVDEEERAKVTN
ncbi:CDP-diacylglycerol--inositol 3-phosphatidyltransferase [Exaiptasia diaphana]|uniref:CDP-diacylglycerol--inositol 3-phosphatidyltransferase n=1 Tax=Exaiptasia diaphana TaxID=2652724 RepID=A0A913YQL9_EXADI|nr:CDP-diacylglycerol--inositol 3-phosphatidyltransferase [Exaiptasia diaphana]